jgi:hypothetical protein
MIGALQSFMGMGSNVLSLLAAGIIYFIIFSIITILMKEPPPLLLIFAAAICLVPWTILSNIIDKEAGKMQNRFKDNANISNGYYGYEGGNNVVILFGHIIASAISVSLGLFIFFGVGLLLVKTIVLLR